MRVIVNERGLRRVEIVCASQRAFYYGACVSVRRIEEHLVAPEAVALVRILGDFGGEGAWQTQQVGRHQQEEGAARVLNGQSIGVEVVNLALRRVCVVYC